MAVIREPEGVDLFVEDSPMTPEDILEIVAWIERQKKDPAQQEALQAALEAIRTIRADPTERLAPSPHY